MSEGSKKFLILLLVISTLVFIGKACSTPDVSTYGNEYTPKSIEQQNNEWRKEVCKTFGC